MRYKLMEKNIFFKLLLSKIILINYLITISLSTSCHIKKNKSNAESFYANEHIKSKDSLDAFTAEKLSDLCAELNLSQITAGVDSFEMRIWPEPWFSNPMHMLIYKYTNNGWLLSKTIFWYSMEEFNSAQKKIQPIRIMVDSFLTVKIKPLLSPELIFDSLKKFDILHIPNQKDISGFEDKIIDGQSYTIEIATKGHYKAVHYNQPDQTKEINNKKIVSLLSFIKKNLADFN
jgi:hypothetical protein